jgi:conjugative transposon TraN protein
MMNKIIFKKILPVVLVCSFAIKGNGQNIVENNDSATAKKRSGQPGINEKNIQSFKIPFLKTTHILSPEPIIYVDISSPNVEGDLPEKNIFRLKPKTDISESEKPMKLVDDFTVTIVSESYITIYKLSFNEDETNPQNENSTSYILTIDPNHSIPLNNHDKITSQDFERLAIRAMGKYRKVFNVHTKEHGMQFWLNNVFVIGNLILFDVAAKNHTNLQYDINSVDFSLMDKNRVRAAVSQDIDLKPIYQFTQDAGTVIDKKWHNYYIFRKFTYPSKKTLEIRLSEKQISGRPVSFRVDYNQILKSKTLITE